MPKPSPDEITGLLQAWSAGDRSALDQLLPLVYGELRRIAGQYMRRERSRQTLQTTALVHEAYLRLVDLSRVSWQDRAHFFAIAARMMRRILVDDAKRRKAEKRGGRMQRVSLDDAAEVPLDPGLDFLALDEALEKLAAVDGRKSQVVELRFYGGLTEAEVAEVLGVAPRTVQREWTLAKA